MSELTQLTHVEPGNAETFNVLGEQLTLLLSATQTRPSLALMEIVSPTSGGPPALHTHPPTEAFYVLEGTYEFSRMGPGGPETLRVTAGGAVYIPSGVPHNYKNVGSAPGRLLAIFTDPAAEAFLRALSVATVDVAGRPVMPPDMAKVGAVMTKYQVAFVGGPPGPP